MPDLRTVLTEVQEFDLAVVTYQRHQRMRQGTWSRPNVPLLIYAGNNVDTSKSTHGTHGGPIAGAAGGHPVQLIFWGGWWTAAGLERRQQIIARTQQLLASPYFSELAQYGVAAPYYRDAVVVTEPAPQLRLTSAKNTERVLDLVDDLLADDVFPDPDDGPRVCFVVLMPDGFTVVDERVRGAHSDDYDFDSPFDSDEFWAGWVRPMDADSTMITVSHEIVEMLVDPEGDAWRWRPSQGSITELSDGCYNGEVRQCAFVNGARVQSYWSNRHAAPVIPIDRDYAARLDGRITERSRKVIGRGTFRLTPEDQALCEPGTPECCFEDRDYEWRTYSINEVARVRLNWQRYVDPRPSWTINGQAVSGAGTITLTVMAEVVNGRESSFAPRSVTVEFAEKSGLGSVVLEIRAIGVNVNFSLIVACSVRDGTITGTLSTDAIATPAMEVDFVCIETLEEDALGEQRTRCFSTLIQRYVREYEPTGRPGPGDPIDRITQLMAKGLPAYVRPQEHRRLRRLAKVARAANAVLPEERARAVTRSLIAGTRILGALARRGG